MGGAGGPGQGAAGRRTLPRGFVWRRAGQAGSSSGRGTACRRPAAACSPFPLGLGLALAGKKGTVPWKTWAMVPSRRTARMT